LVSYGSMRLTLNRKIYFEKFLIFHKHKSDFDKDEY